MRSIHLQRGYANTRAIRVGFGVFTVVMSIAAYIYMYGLAGFAFAAFNPEINYQGKLMNSSNVAVADGVYHMRFRLYTAETGGTLVHLEDRSNVAGNRVTVTNGLFSVMIGSSSPITSVDFNQPLWLEVEVAGTASSSAETLTPRKRLGAVPAAFVADTVDGLNSTQFVRTDEPSTIASTSLTTLLTITQSGTGDILNLFDGATEVFSVLDGGNIGIGTSSPTSLLTVGGATTIAGNLQAANIMATGTLSVSGQTTLATSLNGPLQAINGVISATTSIQDAYISDNITVSGATIGSNSISGTLTTTGTLIIGDGGDRIDVNSSGWDVTNSVFTGGTWQGSAIGTAYGGTGLGTTPQDGELLIGDGLGYTLATLTAGSGIQITNGTGAITIANASTTQWTTSGSNIYYNTGNVGISSSSPNSKLSVNGEVHASYFTATSTTATSSFQNIAFTNGTSTGVLKISALRDAASSLGTTGQLLQSNGSTASWISTSTLGLLAAADIDTCSEIAAVIAGETGTCGSLVFSDSPTFTGTVNTANLSATGATTTSLAISGITQGSILFATSSGTISQDNANFFWNDASNRLGIGTTTPTQALTVVGNMNATGYVDIAADAGGYRIGGTSILNASSTISSIVAGINAGASLVATALNNTAFGDEALRYATSSDYNTAVGYRALRFSSTGGSDNSGSENTAIGSEALFVNTTGALNVAVGSEALIDNTTGDRNVSIGAYSARNNTAGVRNVVMGFLALGTATSSSRNTAIGFQALNSLFTSSANDTEGSVAIGYNAGTSVTTGGANIFIGYQAGDNLTTASKNIVLGYDIDAPSATTDNQLVIGNTIYGVNVDATGATVDSDARIGIGTTSPSARLSIHDTSNIAATAPVFIIATSTSSGTATGTLFTVLGNGNVGIGTTSPANILHLHGTNSSNALVFTNTQNTVGSQGFRIANDNDRLTVQGATDSGGFSSNILAVARAGNVGIGTTSPSHTLAVSTSSATGYVAHISNTDTSNTADGLLISLGVANASRGTGNYFVGFAQTSASTVAGKIQGGASAVAYTTTAADLAEFFPVDDSEDMPEAGDIVALDPENNKGVQRAEEGMVPFGIVTTNPGFIGNGPICKIKDIYCDENYAKKNALVSIVGQVPLKVSNENGAIHAGDSITLSSTTAGVGMKANFGDKSIGYALEDSGSDNATDTIMVYANLHFAYGMDAESSLLDSANELVAGESGETIMQRLVQLAHGFVDGVLSLVELVTEKVTTNELCVADESGNTTCITKSQLDALLAGADVSSGGGTTTPPPDGGDGSGDDGDGGSDDTTGGGTDGGSGTTTPDTPPPPDEEPPPDSDTNPDSNSNPPPEPQPTPEPEPTPEQEPQPESQQESTPEPPADSTTSE